MGREMVFYLVASSGALAVMVILVRALRASTRRQASRQDINLAAARDSLRLADVGQRGAQATAELARELRHDIEMQVVAELAAPPATAAAAGRHRPHWLELLLAVFVPALLAWGGWLLLGSPGLLERPSASTLEQGLVAALRADPADVDGWRLLAKLHSSRGRHAEAATALAQAWAMDGSDPAILAERAFALMRVAGDDFSGQPRALLEQALAIDANHGKALLLAGYAARQAGDVSAARAYWTRVLAQLDPATRDTISAELVALGSTGQGALVVKVDMAPRFQDQVAATAALFVIVRAPATAGPPLAVRRLGPPASWPVTVTVTDADLMLPGARLPVSGTVQVQARMSQQGAARPGGGDIISPLSLATVVKDSVVELTLSSTRAE